MRVEKTPVLITDDSRPIQILLTKLVADLGGQPVLLEQPIRLPKLIKENPEFIVILDLSMPGWSGDLLAKTIHRCEDKDKPVKIVLYSSRADDELSHKAELLKAVAYCSKLQGPEKLRDILSRILSEK